MGSPTFRTAVVADAAESLHSVAVSVIAIGELRDQPKRLAELGDDWSDGPLPMRLTSAGGIDHRTDRAARATYLDSTISGLILGGGQGTWRAHRWLDDTSGGLAVFGAEVVAVAAFGMLGASVSEASRRERLPRPPVSPPQYAVLLHATIDPRHKSLCDIIEAIRALGHRVLSTDLGGGFLASSVHHGEPELVRLVFVSAADGALIDQLRAESADEAASAARQWGYTFAAAVLPVSLTDGRVPDFDLDDAVLEADVPSGCFIAPSADWRITVLRSGVACIGVRPDRRPRSTQSASAISRARQRTDFYDSAELYLHTIYTDAVLLGMLQRHALLVLRNVVLAASRERDSVSRARAIDLELARFREQFWWTQASRGGVGDRLLHAYHVQHAMPEAYELLERDAASVVQRARFHSERGRTAILAMIGLIGLFTACITVGRAISPNLSGVALMIPIGTFVFIAIALFAIFPDLWRLARDAGQRSRFARGRRSM